MGDLPVQAARSAEEDEFAAVQFGNGVLDQRGGDGRTHISFVKREAFAAPFDQVYRRTACGAPERSDLAGRKMLRHIFFDLMGKSDDAGVHFRGVFLPDRIDDGRGKAVKGIGDHIRCLLRFSGTLP